MAALHVVIFDLCTLAVSIHLLGGLACGKQLHPLPHAFILWRMFGWDDYPPPPVHASIVAVLEHERHCLQRTYSVLHKVLLFNTVSGMYYVYNSMKRCVVLVVALIIFTHACLQTDPFHEQIMNMCQSKRTERKVNPWANADVYAADDGDE
jgi:hypothetical protein